MIRTVTVEIDAVAGPLDGYCSRRISLKLSAEHAEAVARVQRLLESQRPAGFAPITPSDAVRHIIAKTAAEMK